MEANYKFLNKTFCCWCRRVAKSGIFQASWAWGEVPCSLHCTTRPVVWELHRRGETPRPQSLSLRGLGHGSDQRFAALNQLQVSGFPQQDRNHLTSVRERGLCLPLGLIWSPWHLTSQRVEEAPLHPLGFGELLKWGKTFPGHQWNGWSMGEGKGEEQEQVGLDGTEKRTAVEEKEKGKREQAKRHYWGEKGRQPKSSGSRSPPAAPGSFPCTLPSNFRPMQAKQRLLPD